MIEIYNSLTGSLEHSLSDYNYKLQPIELNGVDYFEIESQSASIDFFNDAWVTEHLVNNYENNDDYVSLNINPNIVETIPAGRLWCLYYFKIIKNGVSRFVGYCKAKDIEYNKKGQKTKIRLYDAIGRMNDNMKHEFLGNYISIDFHDKLRYAIECSIPTNSADNNKLFEVNYNYDENFGLDIDTDINITNYNNDHEDWTHLFEYNGQSTYGTEITSQVHFWLDDDDLVNLILSKQWQAVMVIWNNGTQSYEARYFESFRVLHLKFSSGIANIIVNTTYSSSQLVSYPDIYEINNIYPSGNATTIYDSNNNLYSIDDSIIHFIGFINVDNILFKEGDNTNLSVAQTLLLINNLTLYVNQVGTLIVSNKTDNNSDAINIADKDVLKYIKSGAEYNGNDLDFTNKIDNIETSNVPNLATVLSQYYQNIILGIKSNISLRIRNNYQINIADKINVYGEDIIVNSIGIDNDDFAYIIEAWSVL